MITFQSTHTGNQAAWNFGELTSNISNHIHTQIILQSTRHMSDMCMWYVNAKNITKFKLV